MKYKGTDLTTGKWIYGYIFKHGEQKFILQSNGRVNEVKPESVVEINEKDYYNYMQYITY